MFLTLQLYKYMQGILSFSEKKKVQLLHDQQLNIQILEFGSLKPQSFGDFVSSQVTDMSQVLAPPCAGLTPINCIISTN